MLHSREWKLERIKHVLDLSNQGEYMDEETWDLERVAQLKPGRWSGNMELPGTRKDSSQMTLN